MPVFIRHKQSAKLVRRRSTDGLMGKMAMTVNLVYCLVLLLVFVKSLQGDLQSVEKCDIERMRVNVEYPGCKNSATFVRVCNGACLSAQTTTNFPTHFNLSCNFCQPTKYRIKPHGVYFICNGIKKRKRFYLPYIQECECQKCLKSSS